MDNHIIAVLCNPVPGKEAEFSDWYANKRLDEVLAVKGYGAGQLFHLSETQAEPRAQSPYRYLVLYEIAAQDLDEFTESVNATAHERPMSALLDRSTLEVWTYTPITERKVAPTVQH